MKFRILLFTFLLAAHLKQHAQLSISTIDSLVSRIRQNNEVYEKKEITLTDSTSMQAFFEHKSLVVAITKDPGTLEKQIEWYYRGPGLMYTETTWSDASGRFLYGEKTYHNSKGMFAWLSTDNTFVDGASSDFYNMDKSLLKQALFLKYKATQEH